ncbi:sigma-70 family RNA polymerase sigma factor [Novipirellula sp.]|uniref:sigma-70 family RNA polymerase sigma factor n=1 Tax=Novipirellula sp. TaxID=2795430 RepID=UPI003565DD7F
MGMHTPNSHSADEATFVGQLTECQLPLMLYVRALMPGDHVASDVIQQTNTKIWEKRADFEPGTNFKAWAFAIARFEVLNHRKQQARDARLRFSDELEVTVADELVALDDDLLQRHAALRECMKSLKPESRELLMCRYASAEPLAEFSKRVGRSVGGIKVTLHRLRSKLADCIEQRLVTSGDME